MKKLMNLLMVLLFVSAMVACGGNAETENTGDDTADTTAVEQNDTQETPDTTATDTTGTPDADATDETTDGDGH